MSRLELCRIRSTDELRAAATNWDALWQRSEVSVPLARAEFVAQWVSQFGQRGAFLALVVKDGETFVAALPLIGSHLPQRLHCGGLTSNPWGLCGDFLLDGAADKTAALETLVEGLNEVPWPLLCLAPVAYESRRWRLLAAAAQSRGLRTLAVFSDRVGQVQIDGRWDDYLAARSGNHRRYLRKARKRAELSGELTLDVHTELSASELETLMRRGCEIEDHNWKGAAGTSILRAPKMFEWHTEQARRMAGYGHLQLTFLSHAGRPIAFEYGYRAKATYFSPKVGYDAAYARFSPGQLLRAMLLERFFSDGKIAHVDFWGPLSDATAKWATAHYPVGKIWIAPRRFSSRLALAGYTAIRRYWRRAPS